MKLFNFAIFALMTLSTTWSYAGDKKFYLDLITRIVVLEVEAPKDQQAPTAETIWVREWLGEDMEDSSAPWRLPILPRQKKDLVDLLVHYKGTQPGHYIRAVNPATNKEEEAKVLAIFANGTLRADFVFYGSTIQHSSYDVPFQMIKDRQIYDLNGVRKDQTLCAINDDKKIDAGDKLEVDGVWASGRVDVNKGGLSELAYALSLTRQKHTHITNLKPCE